MPTTKYTLCVGGDKAQQNNTTPTYKHCLNIFTITLHYSTVQNIKKEDNTYDMQQFENFVTRGFKIIVLFFSLDLLCETKLSIRHVVDISMGGGAGGGGFTPPPPPG